MNATFENPVDRENHIVRGVKVLGFTSANGRIYDFAAVKEAIQKYEKAPVNKDHNMEEPSFSDRLGWLENVILEKDGLYADFHYNPHAEGIESFLWFAEHNGLGDVGFSHLVSGKYSVDPDGTERITRIDKVRSVDLVANPATTKTIFESEVKPMKKKISESSFYRLPKSDIGNTLYEAKMALDSFYSSAKNGNDIKPDYLNNIISLLNNVKKNIKSFNKPDEVKGTVYESDDKPMPKNVEESDSDFKVITKLSGTNDDQVSKREKTYDLYYKGKYLGTVDDIAKVWKIEKEYANKKGSESMKEAEKEKGLEVYGTKGMNNTRFRKTFKSQKEYEKWYDKNEGDIEILGLRDLEGDSKREQEDNNVGEAKQPSQGSEMTVKQLTDLFKDGEWEAYSDVVPNKHVTLFNKSKNKKVNVLVREQEGDDEMDKEKMMEDENPMQQEEAEQDPMMDEADDVYSKIKEVCEGEGSDEEKSKQVLEMLGLSGGMSEAEDDEEMKEEDDEETKEQDSEVLEKENDDEEMKEEDDDEDPKKESKSELKSLRKWKSEKLKQEKIVNLIKESNLEPTRVFVKQLSAIDSKLWSEAIRDRKKVALTRAAVKPISSGSQSRSELSYKQFLESVLGK